jgi:hypothetical protein
MKLALLLACTLPLLAVDGVVVNGTTGKPQEGVAVSLLQPGAGGMQQLGSAKSDAQGQFKIDKDIPPAPASSKPPIRAPPTTRSSPPARPPPASS